MSAQSHALWRYVQCPTKRGRGSCPSEHQEDGMSCYMSLPQIKNKCYKQTVGYVCKHLSLSSFFFFFAKKSTVLYFLSRSSLCITYEVYWPHVTRQVITNGLKKSAHEHFSKSHFNQKIIANDENFFQKTGTWLLGVKFKGQCRSNFGIHFAKNALHGASLKVCPLRFKLGGRVPNHQNLSMHNA